MNQKTKSEQILEIVRELREARAKATPGEWDESLASNEWKENKINNSKFIRLAANKIDQLCEVVQIMTDALNFYSRTGTWENYGSPALEDSGITATEVLTKAAEVLAKDKV